MKIFLLICLASGLASSEKLDRSYLPPPGSKFSGGSPGDIEVPLEFPKETYSTGRPQMADGKPNIELGINRRPASTGAPNSQKPGFNRFQNAYTIPKTTTSYAITQTTTFDPTEDYDGIDQPIGFVNGSTRIQPVFAGQQPIRGPGQGPSYQYRPEQSQPSSVTPYGTTARPLFPGLQKGLGYLPPAPSTSIREQSPGRVSSQDGFSYPSGQPQGPKYQDGQVSINQPGYVTPGFNQQNQYVGNQNAPSSTAAPQYQAGQRLTTPGSIQQNQYPGNQDFPTSTTGPQFQTGQQFTTPGLNQLQFGARVPNQQDQYTGNQYQGNLGFPSSTIAPTPGSIQQNQFAGNQNIPSTAAPNYQIGQRFTTPGQNQVGFVPEQQRFGSRVPYQQIQSQYTGIPSSTAAPQFQNNQQFTTPGPIRQNQYPGNQNFPSTAAPVYQDGQRFATPGQYQGESVPNQQIFGSRIPSQQNQGQYGGNQNFPSSTSAPQYQNGQRFTTPGSQQRFETLEQNQFPGSQTFPSSTTAPQYQDQRFSTPGQQGPLLNQPSFPGSTVAPQYQQTFAPTPGSHQQGFIPSQQNQYQRPAFNQQIPSSTTAPDRFVTGSQPYGNDGIQSTPGMAVSFPESQGGLTGGQPGPTYGSTQQPTSQTFAGSPVYGTAPTTPSRFPNQGFPTTPIGSLPARDFSSTPGFVGEGRPQRPQTEGDRNAEILSYENVLTPEGYSYSYDTSNGIHADETGTVGDGTKAQGGFSYTGDDGKVYSVFYSADENGFQPRGDHLPTPPPIPEAIQRVIDQANRDKESGIEDDGSYNEDKYGYMKYEEPLTRLMPQNTTVSMVNGVDIPDRTESRISGPNKKVFKHKGNKLDTKKYSKIDDGEDVESDLDQIDRTEENSRGDVNIDENKNKNRLVGSKRPKPIKNLVVEGNRLNKLKSNKTPIKSTTSSKADSLQNTKIIKNGPIRRPVTSQEDDEVALDYASDSDISEGKEDNYDQPESQGIDYESDLVNYKDDPNNRTDFHGLNKYLPKPKGTNRKNQLSKNRPTVQVDGTKRPVAGVSKVERPGDRNIQPSQETESGYTGETRTRIPSRKNKFGQKINDQSKVTDEPSLESDDKKNMYNKDNSNTDDEYRSDDETRTVTTDRTDKQSIAKLNKKTSGKLRRPTENERTGIFDNKGIKPSSDEEKGYEYTPPQRKFDEGVIKFPSRKGPQKGIQTTLRPFMTKNVYGDDIEPTDEDIDQYGAVKPGRPGRPITTQKQQYPGFKQDGDSYNESPNSEMNEGERFASTRKPVGQYGTTSSRRPFGRPQTTAMPQYEGENVIGEDKFNEPTIQGSQTPGDKIFYNTNAPFRGTSQSDGNVFSSTTPLPSSESDSFKQYQRPGQYQDRPNEGMYDENAATGGETYRPGASRPGQAPSTTYRPNYSFGDRTLAPNGPVTVDGFGRPIQSTNAPFDGTIRPTYSTVRPTKGQPIEEKFRPSVGRFGDTTQGPLGYQSTSAPIGEDFSGPKQPQRFDPESGYYYK